MVTILTSSVVRTRVEGGTKKMNTTHRIESETRDRFERDGTKILTINIFSSKFIAKIFFEKIIPKWEKNKTQETFTIGHAANFFTCCHSLYPSHIMFVTAVNRKL